MTPVPSTPDASRPAGGAPEGRELVLIDPEAVGGISLRARVEAGEADLVRRPAERADDVRTRDGHALPETERQRLGSRTQRSSARAQRGDYERESTEAPSRTSPPAHRARSCRPWRRLSRMTSSCGTRGTTGASAALASRLRCSSDSFPRSTLWFARWFESAPFSSLPSIYRGNLNNQSPRYEPNPCL